MAETGFGSVSYDPAPTYNDWGFGSPTPLDLDSGEPVIQGRDTAFGSPYDNITAQAYLSGEFDLIPDDGGVVLEINSEWYLAGFNVDVQRRFAPLFPFAATFINQGSGTVYNAIGETGNSCITNAAQTVLYAGVPPLPHGTYTVKVEWFDGTRSLTITDAFTVSFRARCVQAYGLRKHLPSWFATGPSSLSSEVIGEFEGYDSNIEAITKTLGDMLQRLHGRQTTALSNTFTRGESVLYVESTVGYPSTGKLAVRGHFLSYTGKTETSFTGVTTSAYFRTLNTGEEVAYVEPI